MTENNLSLPDLLIRLEQELSRLDLWSDLPPDRQALASTQPFCHDTMPLASWLQWVFIPQIKQLIESGSPLPGSCSIAPIAEIYYPNHRALVAILESIDASFSNPPPLE